MLVLITYDVETINRAGAKRLRLVAKECQNYGVRVQNSVFECVLDYSQMIFLKNRLEFIVDKEHDSIRLYYLGNNWDNKVEKIGIERGVDVTSDLIV
ncbi:MAG: CRISPR-associated endonuclease Cas2 [Bacteroidales bacterium]|nr:CRISPR-associated endonuclease Cas2 [Bacteroidales bacterium]